MPDCIFCKIINKEVAAQIVCEDEDFLVFTDMFPVNPGHLLIIPKRHIEVIFDMPEDLYRKIFEVARALSKPLQEAMESVRVGIVVEGFGVSHTHVHLVPINHAHDLDSENAKPANNDELKKVADKIKQKINKNDSNK
jgi:histidine triad (HIT) family protein